MNLIEKIIANHSKYDKVKTGDIVDIEIDARVARDFGGANVVKNLKDNGLTINDKKKTFFTFDCNPGGSDQKYAANQQLCRIYARENGLVVYDIDAGIGTHHAIDKGLILPGGTFVSTDSHANIMGAIGAFGQGMGDQDIAAVWANGSAWFKVPKSVKLTFVGEKPANISAKDIALNLLATYGANKLLGCSVELYGDAMEKLTLDERITISSMATEMGAISLLFTPNAEILNALNAGHNEKMEIIKADDDATYEAEYTLDISKFVPMVAQPGRPHDDVSVESLKQIPIDSAFIGSCTNGRMEDMAIVAKVLKNRKIAPGVVLKIVPATDDVWNKSLELGYISIFKSAGALVSNAGCAGCAAGQVGQNGPGEVTVSTGNRNFYGKQGKGEVFLASPATVASSAIAGFITTADNIPTSPFVREIAVEADKNSSEVIKEKKKDIAETVAEGRVWLIEQDDIDTDMIFHNRYLTITDIAEMGQYAFDNLVGYEDFAKQVKPTDIVVTAKNFGAGSSRQQAVDCFKALGVSSIIAESYGAIYERNAINAAFPILTCTAEQRKQIELKDGNRIRVDYVTGVFTNLENGKSVKIEPFADVQLEIYNRGGLLG